MKRADLIVILEEIRSAVDRALTRLKSAEPLKAESESDALDPLMASILKTLAGQGRTLSQVSPGIFDLHCPSPQVQAVGRWHPEVSQAE